MHWLFGGKENVWLVCGQAEQRYIKGLGTKDSRLRREVGGLADGEVTGKESNKQAGSGQQCGIQDTRVWVGKQVGREE